MMPRRFAMFMLHIFLTLRSTSCPVRIDSHIGLDRHPNSVCNVQGLTPATRFRRSGIYWHTEEQREMALEAIAGAELLIAEQRGHLGPGEGPNGQYVVAELRRNVTFWRAEERHQQFLEKLGQLATKGADDPIVCFTDSGAGVVERERTDREQASAEQALLDDDDDGEMGGFPDVETIEWEDVQAMEAKARRDSADDE